MAVVADDHAVDDVAVAGNTATSVTTDLTRPWTVTPDEPIKMRVHRKIGPLRQLVPVHPLVSFRSLAHFSNPFIRSSAFSIASHRSHFSITRQVHSAAISAFNRATSCPNAAMRSFARS